MSKIDQAKQYVRTHIPQIVTVASVVTTIGVVTYYQRQTLLVVTPEHVRRLEQGGHYTYVALNRVFHLTLAD